MHSIYTVYNHVFRIYPYHYNVPLSCIMNITIDNNISFSERSTSTTTRVTLKHHAILILLEYHLSCLALNILNLHLTLIFYSVGTEIVVQICVHISIYCRMIALIIGAASDPSNAVT